MSREKRRVARDFIATAKEMAVLDRTNHKRFTILRRNMEKLAKDWRGLGGSDDIQEIIAYGQP